MTEASMALPPALRPVAEVLALSDGFSLSVITGPRGNCDSVYLRLFRALEPAVEVVRHRVDLDGPGLTPVLMAQGERPRVVFVSGLEALADEPRRDVTTQLNLLRDTWAALPSRVVLWLPSWSLKEFRQLAPDLFHWRSVLVSLHDADLPVRDELEYLVWACERYRGKWHRREWKEAFGTVLEHWQDADASSWGVRLTDLLRAPERTVLLGLKPTERTQTLRDLALYGALNSLWDLGERLPTDGEDRTLDIFVRGEVIRVRGQRLLPALLVETLDAVGSLTPHDGWTSLARAAGLASPETAAVVLAELAERAGLAVVLDAPDLLDLSPGSVARTWLAWLTSVCPTLIAATAGPPSDVFSDWTHRWLRHEAPPLVQHRRQALHELLQELFSPAELHQWALFWFGYDAAKDLPGASAPPQRLVDEFIDFAERNGVLDLAFFEELKRLRPRRAREIDRIAGVYLAGRSA